MNINDVATLAGVSTATVSHVINKTRYVSEETTLAVQAAIAKVGYTPNIHARNLAAGYSRTLGLIISDITNPFFPDLVKTIQDCALEPGYEVIVANTDYQSEHDVPCVQRLLEFRVRGVMFLTTEKNDAAMERLLQSRTPTVYLDIGKVGPLASNIRIDYEKGVHEAVEHLLALGHKRIAFISGPSHLVSAQLRRAAFVSAMQKYESSRSTPAILCEGDFRLESGQRAVRELLARDEKPTAIVAANDLMALGALGELKKAGLSVPRDVSIVGCDDVYLASLVDPPLTTIMIPRAEIGRAAVEAVLQMKAEGGPPGREIRIGTKLVVRGSSVPARLA